MPRADLLRMLLLLVPAALLAGCGSPGPKPVPVRGLVTYQGKPLPTGNVMFVPAEGPAASSAISAGGTYRLDALPGTYRVVVTAMPAPPPGFDPMTSSQEYVPPKSLIPAKYNRAATSGLAIEVKSSGENLIDISLP